MRDRLIHAYALFEAAGLLFVLLVLTPFLWLYWLTQRSKWQREMERPIRGGHWNHEERAA